MNRDHLEELAAGYASGALESAEKQAFAQAMKENSQIQKMTDELHEVATHVIAHPAKSGHPRPSNRLKERIMTRIALPEKQRQAEPVLAALAGGSDACVVICNREGLIEWINPAFTELCGYTLDEVHGRKPGKFLQGAETDRETISRMRAALRDKRGFCEEVINYHKNGSPYRVSVAVTPVFDAAGEVSALIALERKIG